MLFVKTPRFNLAFTLLFQSENVCCLVWMSSFPLCYFCLPKMFIFTRPPALFSRSSQRCQYRNHSTFIFAKHASHTVTSCTSLRGTEVWLFLYHVSSDLCRGLLDVVRKGLGKWQRPSNTFFFNSKSRWQRDISYWTIYIFVWKL